MPASNLHRKSTVKCTYVKMATEGFIMRQINRGSRPYNLVLHFSGCFLRAEPLIISSYCLQQETDSQIQPGPVFLCMSFFLIHFLTHSLPAFKPDIGFAVSLHFPPLLFCGFPVVFCRHDTCATTVTPVWRPRQVVLSLRAYECVGAGK